MDAVTVALICGLVSGFVCSWVGIFANNRRHNKRYNRLIIEHDSAIVDLTDYINGLKEELQNKSN